MPPKLGILAGGGSIPKHLIDACEKQHRPCFVVAIEDNADPESISSATHCYVNLGSIGKIIDSLKKADVREVVMAGRVERPSWREMHLDRRALKMLPKVLAGGQGDGSILSLVIKELELEGFRVVGIDDILGDVLTPEGCLGEHQPDGMAQDDISRAMEVGLALGSVDVGQAVVVQQGVVLGVEAIEGTDSLLERCSELRLTGNGGVLLKLKKVTQDRRVDLPTMGPDTVTKAIVAGLRGIALEARASLLVDRESIVKDADLGGIFVIGVKVQRCPE